MEGLQHALRIDRELYELAHCPLMLNIFTLAYQGAAPAGLPTEGTREVQQRQVFATYIERMLARRRISKHISRENTLRWLTFLAARMQQHHQTMFSLEQIQPDWLEEPRSRSLYRLSAWLVLSPLLVLLGLTFLLLMRHIVISLIVVIAFSLVTMPFNALLGRQLIGNNQLFDTLEGELTQIQPREAFRWSRKEISPMINSRRSVWSAMVPAILGSVTGSVGILVVLVITHPSSLSERTEQRSHRPFRQRVRPSRHGRKQLNGAWSPIENGR